MTYGPDNSKKGVQFLFGDRGGDRRHFFQHSVQAHLEVQSTVYLVDTVSRFSELRGVICETDNLCSTDPD